jgi:hypothetical protein
VIETVREKFTCRDCEAISQPPAPFHATPRGFIGPHLLATILFDKFGMHSPLNRQSTRFKCEGIELSTSTLADQVGYGTAALLPIFELIEAHVFAAERLFGDDTTIPIQAKDKCTTGRIWTYVCDDRPYGGAAAPAAIYYASSDRRGEHPQKHLAGFGDILQSDCYNGFEPLSVAEKKAVLITFAFCHAHARREFFELADIQKRARDRKRKGKPISPIALEAVQRYDALFEIECQINGLSAAERLAARQEKSKPLFDDMHEWLKRERATLSKSVGGDRADRLHAEAMGWFCAFPRRWPDLSHEQYGRARAERNCTRASKLDLRRFPTWGRSCRHHALRYHDLPSQQRRPKGVAFRRMQACACRLRACRCVRTHRRSSCLPPARTAALAMEVTQRDGYCGGRVNSARNNASERSKPSSVRISDFDLLTGSPIKPFL